MHPSTGLCAADMRSVRAEAHCVQNTGALASCTTGFVGHFTSVLTDCCRSARLTCGGSLDLELEAVQDRAMATTE